ncbi:hypothetical protein JCM10207_000654 [Rhodosporidiobolus poonsookiae]
MDSPPCPLTALPPELVLRLLSFLDPQSIVRLSSTSSALLAIAREDSLWRHIVTHLVSLHHIPNPYPEQAAPPPPALAQHSDSWWDRASFLLPLSNRLGYFASSKQFTSRIIRVGIVSTPSSPPSPDAPPPRYTLHASHLRLRNAHDLPPARPLPAALLPFGAVTDAIQPSAYMVSPNHNPSHPYAGLSVDVLEPHYAFDAHMFAVSPEDGATLCQPRPDATAGLTTRETVLAAVFGAAGVPTPPPAGPAPTPPLTPSGSPFRLRLALETVEQRVERSTARFRPSSPGQNDDSADGDEAAGDTAERAFAQAARAARSREQLYALLSGRMPRTAWPTLDLVGLEEIARADLGGEGEEAAAAGGTVLRVAAGAGAFRGLEEWLTRREGEGGETLARVEEPDEPGGREEAFVSGFRLRAKRTPKTSFARAPSAVPTEEGGAGAARRRGVGANGGMAVLWNGAERDPDEDRPVVTLLRAGDEADGGVVLRLPHSPEPAEPLPLPTPSPPPRSPSSSPASDHLADAIDSSSEAFFPIHAPARPLSFSSPGATDEHGEIRASSLAGLWVGTYGPHGVEVVHLSVGFAEVPASLSPLEPGSPLSTSAAEDPLLRAASRPRTSYRRIVTATKVTGDANVPAGQTTWVAVLPSPELSARALSPAALVDGPVPSVSKSRFDHLASLDPLSREYAAVNRGAGPDWREGTARAWARVALTGFTSASWTAAEARFLRSETVVRSEDGEEERTLETVEEIQLRWDELHKVGCFRRMRI